MCWFAGRSQMSAALFNEHADPSKAKAISAGTNPSITGVHAVCVTVMQVTAFDIFTPFALPAAMVTPCLSVKEV
jgi:protein-tyrosine-phosphatase